MKASRSRCRPGALGVGGTRFAKFPIPGEPIGIHEKLEDAAVVNQLGRMTPTASPHFPWDKVDDPAALKEEAAELGLGFDAVNSNTFQDQPGQAWSYKFGSLTHTDKAVRDQAIAHNIDCIDLGVALGSKAITVWIGDGANFPGQQNQTRAFDRYLDSMSQIYAALPADWRMFMEHKLYEPAFYSTVISDWGTNLIAAQQLGEKARCLVDLGHHAPNVNIEQIVARLARFGKLGGFHFNDCKYGDDDLDAGSINPHQLFLIFNELVEAEARANGGFDPAYMIDQSHNVTDPIESLLLSAGAIAGSYARALLVDREALAEHQDANDVVLAFSDPAPRLRDRRRPDPRHGALRGSAARSTRSTSTAPASGGHARRRNAGAPPPRRGSCDRPRSVMAGRPVPAAHERPGWWIGALSAARRARVHGSPGHARR